MNAAAPVAERVLDILSQVTGSEDVRGFPDAELYSSGILDSLATVSLMLALEDAFAITISPADFDRENWATPRRLVADVENRVARRE
jgi:D-alanine--poly(phosphoribitol) ligase subunit 2